jgi:hypothetical protein
LCATLKDDTTDKNEQKSERQNTYASAKSKELHPHAPTNAMQHICFCPTAPQQQ